MHAEALARGYRFDCGLIGSAVARGTIPVTRGQIELEWAHLKVKLERRDPARAARCGAVAFPAPHPLFRIVPGGVEAWERAGAAR